MRKLWIVFTVASGMLGSALAQGSSDGEKAKAGTPSRKHAVVIVPFRKPFTFSKDMEIDWTSIGIRAMEIVEGKLAEMGRKVFKRADLSEVSRDEMIKLIKQGAAPGRSLAGAEFIVQGSITKASREVKSELIQKVQRITIGTEVQIIEVRSSEVRKTARGEFTHVSRDNFIDNFTPVDVAAIDALQKSLDKLVVEVNTGLTDLDATIGEVSAIDTALPPVINDRAGNIDDSEELGKPPAHGKFVVVVTDAEGIPGRGVGALAENIVVNYLINRQYKVVEPSQAAAVLDADKLRKLAQGDLDEETRNNLKREFQADYLVHGTIEPFPSDGLGIPEVRARLSFRAFTTATARRIGMDYVEVVAQGADEQAALDKAVEITAERASKLLHLRLLKWTQSATIARLVITSIPNFNDALELKSNLLRVPGIEGIEYEWIDGKMEMDVKIDTKRITQLATAIISDPTIRVRYELDVVRSNPSESIIKFVRKKTAKPNPPRPTKGPVRP